MRVRDHAQIAEVVTGGINKVHGVLEHRHPHRLQVLFQRRRGGRLLAGRVSASTAARSEHCPTGERRRPARDPPVEHCAPRPRCRPRRRPARARRAGRALEIGPRPRLKATIAAAAFSNTASRTGPGRSGEHIAGDAGVGLGVPAAQVSRSTLVDPELASGPASSHAPAHR